MPTRTVSPTVSVRVSPALYKQFKQKSTKYGGVSEVLRELMLALVEDRISIKAPAITENSLYSISLTTN